MRRRSYAESLLSEREVLLMKTHQHPLILIGAILAEIALAVAIIVMVTLLLTRLNARPIWALGYVLLLLPILSLVRDVLIWSNRQYIITNRRVIQTSGVLNRHVMDSSLEKVNDIKLEQSFLGRILNYGDVEILTASEAGSNVFRRIANPTGFKKALLNARDAAEAGGGVTEDIPTLIARLDELRKQGILSDEEFQRKKQELLAKL